MTTFLLALVLGVAQAAPPPTLADQDKPKTPYETLFPNPTGKNGFEEYVLAGMAANEALRGVDSREWPSLFERHRSVAQQAGRTLQLMREGNKKPVSDPREKFTFDSYFPELASFKSVTKVAQSDMYHRFAVGDTAGATTTFLDAATFVERSIPTPSLIACLVAIAQDAILLATFEQFSSRLSLNDLNRIETYSRGRILRSLPLDKALQIELGMQDEYLRMPMDEWMAVDEGDEDYELLLAIQKLGPEQRRELVVEALKVNRANIDRIIATYRGRESAWRLFEPAKTGDKLVDALVKTFSIGDMAGQLMSAVAKQRTQWRLLLLHALIEKYRLLQGKLPESLPQLGLNDEIADPLVEDLFVYKPVSIRDFELYSKGNDLTGPIAIRYRRVQSGDGDVAVPPPL